MKCHTEESDIKFENKLIKNFYVKLYVAVKIKDKRMRAYVHLTSDAKLYSPYKIANVIQDKFNDIDNNEDESIMIEMTQLNSDEIEVRGNVKWYTTTEAAEIWKLDPSTVKKACQNERFEADEYRKSAGTWLVSSKGMSRLYGENK